jgi:hypothetical protein
MRKIGPGYALYNTSGVLFTDIVCSLKYINAVFKYFNKV